ncbi:MAG TPA: hypothetical protein VFQ68_07685 [Streptosporangiaceae bacterium]|nr:hypothetical protein [Streptosporangiaceae bacterium]
MLKLAGKRIGAGVTMRMSRVLRQAVAMTAAVAVTFLLASCAPADTASSQATAAGNNRVITLNTISTLKSLFNRDDGHPRLIVIFSPT